MLVEVGDQGVHAGCGGGVRGYGVAAEVPRVPRHSCGAGMSDPEDRAKIAREAKALEAAQRPVEATLATFDLLEMLLDRADEEDRRDV